MKRRDPSRHTCAVDPATCRMCAQQRQIAPDEHANLAPHEPTWTGSDLERTPAEREVARKGRATKGRESRWSGARLAATRRGEGDEP